VIAGRSSFEVSSVIVSSGSIAISLQADASLDRIAYTDLSDSSVTGVSASFPESVIVGRSSFKVSSVLASSGSIAISRQVDTLLNQIAYTDLSDSSVTGGSESFPESVIVGRSSFEVSSVLASSGIADLSNQFGGSPGARSIQLDPSVEGLSKDLGRSVVETVSTEMPMSGQVGEASSFSGSGIARGSSSEVSSALAPSEIDGLSNRLDTLVARGLSVDFPVSDVPGNSALCSDSGVARPQSFGVSSIICPSTPPGNSLVVGLSLSFGCSQLMGLTSIADQAVQGSGNQSLRPLVSGESDVWPGLGAGEAQQAGSLSAGEIAGGVVGSLGAALGLAAGVIFLLILRRKRDAPGPSCHESCVETPEGDTFEEFSEVFSEVNGSFDEAPDEALHLSGPEHNRTDGAER
jgi:hypothetical protein